MNPVDATESLNDRLKDFSFDNKVDTYYNPLDYAFSVHKAYLTKFGNSPRQAFFLGMNPGPWGMAQTGVPFTDPYIARDWMDLPQKTVGTPQKERDDRPVEGWQSDRKEASGQRLFGFLRELYGSLNAFFEVGIVSNYCPLVMFSEEGTNLTPEDLLKEDREPLFEACDPYIDALIEFYDPDEFVGIGRFAQRRLADITDSDEDKIAYLPHPSPASPIATRDNGEYWRGMVKDLLQEHGMI